MLLYLCDSHTHKLTFVDVSTSIISYINHINTITLYFLFKFFPFFIDFYTVKKYMIVHIIHYNTKGHSGVAFCFLHSRNYENKNTI